MSCTVVPFVWLKSPCAGVPRGEEVVDVLDGQAVDAVPVAGARPEVGDGHDHIARAGGVAADADVVVVARGRAELNAGGQQVAARARRALIVVAHEGGVVADRADRRTVDGEFGVEVAAAEVHRRGAGDGDELEPDVVEEARGKGRSRTACGRSSWRCRSRTRGRPWRRLRRRGRTRRWPGTSRPRSGCRCPRRCRTR